MHAALFGKGSEIGVESLIKKPKIYFVLNTVAN